MTKLIIAVGLVLAAGCGSKTDNALSEFEGLKTRMCECKDKGCAEAVQKDLKDWQQKMKESGTSKKDLSDDQKKRAREIDKEMDACGDKLLK